MDNTKNISVANTLTNGKKNTSDKAKNIKLNNSNSKIIFDLLAVNYTAENGKIVKSINMNASIIDACNKAIFDYYISGSKTYLLFDNLLQKLQTKSKTQLKALYGKALLDCTASDKVYNRNEKNYHIDVKISLARFCELVKNNLQLLDKPKTKNELL